MAQIIKFVSKCKEVMFVCSARDTRNGFAHDAQFFINGRQWGEGHCYYLNRTWEHWHYQSACLTAVQNCIDVRKGDLKDDYKDAAGIKRLCGKKHKDALQGWYDSDSELILLRDIKQTLLERCF